MKIAVINSLYRPYNRGGAEIVVEKQVEELSAQNQKVIIITTKPRDNKKTEEKGIYKISPINIFSYYSLNKHNFILRFIWWCFDVFNLDSYFKVGKILKQEKPDLIIAHNLAGFGFLLPVLFRRLKIKYIQVMHDVSLVFPSGLLIYGKEHGWQKKCLILKVWRIIARKIFGSPEEIIFPSEWLKNFYEEWQFFKNSKKIVRRNFIIEKKNIIKEKTKGKLKLLYVGQIEKHKGIFFLLETLSKLKIENYKLQIVGAGSRDLELKKKIKNNENIKYFGWKNQSELNKYFEWTDYTIVPSLCYENSPTVIFESLQNNTPVIASDLGGIPELVEDKKNGYLFEPGNKEGLGKILQKLT